MNPILDQLGVFDEFIPDQMVLVECAQFFPVFFRSFDGNTPVTGLENYQISLDSLADQINVDQVRAGSSTRRDQQNWTRGNHADRFPHPGAVFNKKRGCWHRIQPVSPYPMAENRSWTTFRWDEPTREPSAITTGED